MIDSQLLPVLFSADSYMIKNEGKLYGLEKLEEGNDLYTTTGTTPGTRSSSNSSNDLSLFKSVSPTGEVAKSCEGHQPQHEEVRSPVSSTSSSSDGEKENYLGKVPRKEHKKLKRSLGSGFELVELQQLSPDCPPIIVQLGVSEGMAGGRSPPGAGGSSVGSRDENDSCGELPPEEHWRDGVFSCFKSFFPIGFVACFGTSVAQLEVIQALGFSPSFCQSFSMLFTVGSLWLAVGATLMFGLYPFAAAAFAMILLLESYVAFRLRTVVRRRYNIEGNACQDCLLSTLMTSCVTAQILRHLK